MDTEQITQIIDLMKESDLTEFEIEQKGLKLRIKRRTQEPCGSVPMPPLGPPQVQVSSSPHHSPIPETQEVKEDKNIEIIKSPMVGTFYQSPSPDSPPFIAVGNAVDSATVVCIIEAMKVMNEIQAEIQGTITEILIKNGQTVEYGQPMFKVKVN